MEATNSGPVLKPDAFNKAHATTPKPTAIQVVTNIWDGHKRPDIPGGNIFDMLSDPAKVTPRQRAHVETLMREELAKAGKELTDTTDLASEYRGLLVEKAKAAKIEQEDIDEVTVASEQKNEQDLAHTETKLDLEQKAQELATRITTEGIGIMHGKFPDTLVQYAREGFTYSLGFIIGEKLGLDNNSRSDQHMLVRLINHHFPKNLYQDFNHLDRYIWVKSTYAVPTTTMTVTEKAGFLRSRTVTKIERATFHGKSGEEGWVHYEYYMPTDHYAHDPRRGGFYLYSMAVPPEIALQIDEGVKQDPTFPDTLLKSIYPGKFGSDKHQYLKRNQANEIMFLDLT